MSIAASGDGQSFSEDEDSAELHPSGVAAAAKSDPELTAVLSRAARSGLEACTPPSPEPSQRDDWCLGTGRGSRPRPALVPFFPEVHEELTKSWTAPFYGQKRLICLLHPRLGGTLTFPRWRVHLCLQNAATWRNRPRLPSSSPAGQAASALHAMAPSSTPSQGIKMHEGSTNPRLKQELRSATDLALRATEVTAQSLGKAMSTLVVQERHLWLSLAERSDIDKARFLDTLVSQAGLFDDTVEDCSAVLGSTEADRGYPTHLAPA